MFYRFYHNYAMFLKLKSNFNFNFNLFDNIAMSLYKFISINMPSKTVLFKRLWNSSCLV